MSKKIILLIMLLGVFYYALYAQQQQPKDSHEGHSHAQPAQPNSQPAPTSGPKQSKYGTVKAKGSPLSFLNKGEGTLKLSGQGVILISDLNGSLQVQGFKELKQLPKGVVIKPPMDKRIRMFQGTGSMTIKGKYGSVRVKLVQGQMEYIGSGSLNIDGKGKFVHDGKEGDLISVGTMTLFVPTPEWMKQQLKEGDPLIAPKGKRGDSK